MSARGAPGYQAAVVGHPVSHSLSPVLHQAAYSWLGLDDWRYEILDLAPEDVESLLVRVGAAAGDGPVWAGLSVTMPHKQVLLGLLDVVDPLARSVGAVNTVVAQRSGTGPALLAGFNTDVAGIVEALRDTTGQPGSGTAVRAVILGSGATACSALAALTELGATQITVAARRHAGPGRALAAARRMGLDVRALTWRPGQPSSDTEVAVTLAEADLVVSTLPASGADGVAGSLTAALRDRGGPRAGAALLDVVYDPWPTALVQAWEQGGGAVAPGWLMLLHQAVHQVRLMTGRSPDPAPLRAALLRALGTTASLGPV